MTTMVGPSTPASASRVGSVPSVPTTWRSSGREAFSTATAGVEAAMPASINRTETVGSVRLAI